MQLHVADSGEEYIRRGMSASIHSPFLSKSLLFFSHLVRKDMENWRGRPGTGTHEARITMMAAVVVVVVRE